DVALDANAALPPQVTAGAKESLGSAVILAGGLSTEAGQGLLSLAKESFMDGWLAIFWAICAFGIMGMSFALKLMPSRDLSLEPKLRGVSGK
ncbi:MAG: hypothetical protein PVG60_01230, partial [Desulfarculaceae bacterium]